MKNRFKQKLLPLFCTAVLLLTALPIQANAENLPCQTAVATGSYSHPQTGVIEDSGGESNEALGQSMVSNVVDSKALVETTQNGDYLISIRFHLMNSLSDIKLYLQAPGSSSWSSLSYEKTASGNDTGDLRFQVSDTNVIIKAECMVDAMGRYVIFYITFGNFTDGNAGGFVQTESEKTSVQEQTDTADDKEFQTFTTPELSTEAAQEAVSDPLEGVEGMSIGGTPSAAKTTAAQISDSDTPLAQNTETATLSAQPLSISGQVWFMLFVILFCANLLSGLALWGIKYLTQYIREKKHKNEEAVSADEDNTEDDFSYLEDCDNTDCEVYDENEV